MTRILPIFAAQNKYIANLILSDMKSSTTIITKAGVSLALMFFLLFSFNKIYAQLDHGTPGQEVEHVTINFSDIAAYEAVHPVDTSINHLIHEIEYDHTAFISDHFANQLSPQNVQVLPPTFNATASPAPAANFNGVTDNNQFIPPDSYGAVGPNHIMTTVNSQVRITDKTGNTQYSIVALSNFWSAAFSVSTVVCDPKIAYDPYNNRWIFISLNGDSAAVASIFIGVSQTNDPTGSWNLFKVMVNVSGDWMDFPNLGFNKNWIVVSGNLFSNAGTFQAAKVWAFNKANLYSNTSASFTTFTNLPNDFCLTAARTYDATMNDLFMLESFNGPVGQIKMFKVSGTAASPTFSTVGTYTSSTHWASGFSATNAGPQTGTTNKINCGDDRFSTVIYRGGYLWTAHNAFLPSSSPTRCSAQWLQMDTVGNFTQNGLIDDATGVNYYIYPSIAVNVNNDAVCGFTNLSSSIHPSSGYCFRSHNDAVNTFETPYIFKSGLNTYFKTFGGSSNRWGDYSGTMVDPSNDSTFWTIQEYSEAAANTWGTWWAKIIDGCSTPAQPGAITGSTSVCASSPHNYSITAVSGASGYTWTVPSGATITSGQNTTSITVIFGNTSGNVTVLASNTCGNSATQSAVVTVNALPVASISGVSSVCQGTSATLTASGGTTYIWNTGATTTGISVTPTTTTTYTVTATSNGCTGTATKSVTVNSLPTATITANGNTTFCQGGSVTLTSSSGSSYSWSNGATTSSITVASSGSYSVVVTNANGCSASSSATSVTVNPLPTATITANGNTTFCQGGSVTLTSSSGSFYSWSDGETTSSITVTTSGNYSVVVSNANGCSASSSATSVTVNPLPTATITASGYTTFCQGGSVTLTSSGGSFYSWSDGETTSSITVTTSGNYSVVVTNANGCSASSSATSVIVNPLPTATITANGNTTFCQGGSVTLTSSGGSFYSWSDGETTSSITVISSGNYSVVVTNANGCSASSSATSVTVNPLPTATITPSGNTTFCQGGSVTLASSGGSFYSWSDGETTSSITVASSGNYSVVVTNANGCSASSSSTSVTVYPLPTVTITPSGNTTFCQGGSVTLTSSGGSFYSWSDGETTSSITVASSGNYSVVVSNANGCSASSSATSVTVYPLPTVTITPSGNTTFCQGGSVTLTSSGGSFYSWSDGETTSSITVASSGNYSVVVSNANGCSASSSATSVTVYPLPTVTITPSGNTTFCQGGSVTLTSSGGSFYSWSDGETTSSITVTTSGNYSVVVTNANGCSASSSSTSITVNPLPTAAITTSGNTTFCQGGSVTLTSSGGSFYSWSDGETTSSIIVTSSGNYSVVVTDVNGCSASSSSTSIIVNPSPRPAITGPSIVCGTTQIALSAGAFSSYHWSTNATTDSITVSSSGIYSVTVSNSFGCTGTASKTITTGSIASPTITASGATSFCPGGSVTLSTGAFSSYNWSNGNTTASITVSSSATYVVTVTNSSGCTGSASKVVMVYVSPAPIISVSNMSTYCSGGTENLSTTAFTTYHWSTGATTQLITISTNGIFTITVTNSNGCTGTASTTQSNSCSVPTSLSTTSITGTSAMITWVQPSCYYGYTIQRSIHNANVWTSFTITPNMHYTFSGLALNTSYDWQIRTNCNAAQTNISAWSPVQTFTTLAHRIDGEPISENSNFSIIPNPASYQATILFSSDNEVPYTISLIDITGKVTFNACNTAVIGDNQYMMDVSQVAKGIYIVLLQKGDAVMRTKLVVQ